MNEEETIYRHKQEKKELQSKIQSLKKSVNKADKKKKKEIAEQIAQLEKDLESRHNTELLSFKLGVNTDDTVDVLKVNDEEKSVNENDQIEQEKVNTRISRAQKRRDKKAIQEKEREQEISAQIEKNKDRPKAIELSSIKEALNKMGLTLYDIAADGNCLYCAINHQLMINNQDSISVSKLRKLTADFIRENRADFMPFMYSDSGEPVDESSFNDYCNKVATTKLWGGHLELKALSNILKCPIKVIQAKGPPTILGEDFDGPQLILTYHRFLYHLGEHYNSTINIQKEND